MLASHLQSEVGSIGRWRSVGQPVADSQSYSGFARTCHEYRGCHEVGSDEPQLKAVGHRRCHNSVANIVSWIGGRIKDGLRGECHS